MYHLLTRFIPKLKKFIEYITENDSYSNNVKTIFRVSSFEQSNLHSEKIVLRNGLAQSMFENIINPKTDEEFRKIYFEDWLKIIVNYAEKFPNYLLETDPRKVFELEAGIFANTIAISFASITENHPFTNERLPMIPDDPTELHNFRKKYWTQHLLNITEHIIKKAINAYNEDKKNDEETLSFLLNPSITEEDKNTRLDMGELGFYFHTPAN